MWNRQNDLDFLLSQAVFEEAEHWNLLSINITVFANTDGAIEIHVLAGEELQFLEAGQQVLDVFVQVFLKLSSILWVFLFDLLEDPAFGTNKQNEKYRNTLY